MPQYFQDCPKAPLLCGPLLQQSVEMCRNAEKGHRAQLPRITGEATGTDRTDREVE